MAIERTAEIRQLRLRVPQAELDSLYQRLRGFRDGGDYIAAGLDRIVPAAYADDLLDYWVSGYDWRAHESRLNTYDHYSTEIAGQFVHFLHLRAADPNAQPVLLTHAWPSGVMDVLDTALPYEAQGGHHLVIPSIAWTALAGLPEGSPSRRTAAGWDELMCRLGYSNYRVGDDRNGLAGTPAYTAVTESQAEQRGLDAVELAEVRWFNENLTAFNERQQVSALVLSTALLAWNAQLVDVSLDRDALLTGLTLAWFAAQLPTE
ncbi:epoxide hydrolase N-terminal domain-containing protein [Kribbella sp. CA-293567]|uniref:epoxide hydrolase N-terminal domain-containing protein n=1 Tax=Kribbella sp. CA-293567 TaxID=3002436 RepID=UPI0022DD327A|nr:epoxide hydrolase N-terminal domain-containing protein [Kribbella sp. CA-293567]WBQ04718.1 epoxide hydrolase N-terminal domain-containing protein [Kribbella sp. CA-293567]